MKPLVPLQGRKARVAILLSGSGTNAREILKQHSALRENSPVQPVCLVTDRPDSPSCRAQAIAQEFGIPEVAHDVVEFYHARGLKTITVRTEEGLRARKAWTAELIKKLKPFHLDFAILAGFELLSNITREFPCLNVHPGDLTYLKHGKRYLIGLHTVPIERAILEGLKELHSSVILALPYHGKGEDMDTGPVLGISPPVQVNLEGHTLEELAKVSESRPSKRPAGGYKDLLEEIASRNQQRLKQGGDWVVFPGVVFEVAREHLAVGEDGRTFFRRHRSEDFRPVKRLVFGKEEVWEEN